MSTTETHPAPIDITRVFSTSADGIRDGYAIEVSLTHVATRDILRALARRAYIAAANGAPLQLARRLLVVGATKGVDQSDALTRLTQHIGDHTWPTWHLTPDDATALGNALLDLAEDPPECGCGAGLVDLTDELLVCSNCHWLNKPIGA